MFKNVLIISAVLLLFTRVIALEDCSNCKNLSFDPVCGANNQTFTNVCFLELCAKQELASFGACPGAPCDCPRDYKNPICGKDQVTYGNMCQLKCVGMEMKHIGLCYNCRASCPSQYFPVCGTDNQTYRNRCELDCANVPFNESIS
jgi:hypothetical protein